MLRLGAIVALSGLVACSVNTQRDGAVPALSSDGDWEVSEPEALGFSREPLERMAAEIGRGELPNVHAVLIAKDGLLVYEEYFEGTDRRHEGGRLRDVATRFERDTLHDLRSVTKSVVSALVGAAVAAGEIDSLDQSLLALFPEYESRAGVGVEAMTVRHALTMTGGFDWNEGDVPYTNPDNHDERKSHSTDPVGFVLGRPLEVEPGTVWDYNGGLPTLLGFAVARASGQPLGAFARERLFAPLGITDCEWAGPQAWTELPEMRWEGHRDWAKNCDPASALWMRPRDLLKFGLLYANGGEWRGRRILEPEWVAASLEARVARGEGMYELGGGWLRQRAYGYYWYHDRYTLPYGDIVVHSAAGNGGQRIWIVPELGVVSVHLAGNYNEPGYAWNADRVLLEHVLPWALGVPASYQHTSSRPVRLVPAGEWPLEPLAAETLERYVGEYEEQEGVSIQIRATGSRLQLMPPGGAEGRLDLIPVEEDVFLVGRVEEGEVRRIYWPRSSMVFNLDPGGHAAGYEVREPGSQVLVGKRVH